ncbi:MAG: PAS domain-containing protein [Chloroflexi bacterium]|nr:PAS domain-containing protein [Chloroflexota bacterium]
MPSPLRIAIAADALHTADTLLRACRQANLRIASWCACSPNATDRLPAGSADLALVALEGDGTAAREAVRGLHAADRHLPIVLVGPDPSADPGDLAREPGVGAWAWAGDREALAAAVRQAVAAAGHRPRAAGAPQPTAEDAIRESEARLRSLFRYMEEAFLLLEPVRDAGGAIVDFRVLEANPAAEALGPRAMRERGSLLGCSVQEYVPEIVPSLAAAFTRMAESDEAQYIKRRDPIQGRFYSGYLYRPAADRCALIFQDVTEQEMLLRAHRHQRTLLEVMVDASSVALAVMRAEDGILELANPAYQASTLLRDVPLAGRHVSEAFPGPIAQTILDRVAQVSRTGETSRFRTQEVVMTPGAACTYWDADYVPLPEADGSSPRVLIIGHEVTDRVLQGRALEDSEARLRAVLDVLPVGVHIADAEGRIHTVNQAGRRIWGGVPLASSPERYHTDYPARWADSGQAIAESEWALARAIRRGETSIAEEIEIEARDGRRKTILNYALPIRDAEGATAGGVSVNVDISSRREAERALQRRLAELEVLYYASQALQEHPDSGILLQRLCDIAVESAGLRKAWVGLTSDAPDVPSGLEAVAVARATSDSHSLGPLQETVRVDMRSRPALEALRTRTPVVVDDLVADDTADPAWREGELAKGHRAVGAFPLVIERQVVGVLVVYAPEAGGLGAERVQSLRSLAYLASVALERARLFEQVNAYAAELEERVAQRTAALLTSERRFRAIYEGAALGVLLLDLEGRIQASNPASARLLGYGADALRGQSFAGLLAPGAGAESFSAEYGAYAYSEHGGRPRRWEVRFRRRDGTLRWGSVTVTCVPDAESGGQFAIVMLEDVTEEQAARATLIEAERLRAVTQLSAALAHEIKNPLQGVLGALQLLREALSAETVAEPYIEAASEGLWRVDRVVGRLGEIHQQHHADERRPTDLRELVEQTLLLTERQRLQHHVHTVVEMPADLPRPVLSPDLIQRVFLNLVLNAYEAMQGGGSLTIRGQATTDPAGVTLEVEDTGAGIPPEALAHVFDFAYPTSPQAPRLGLFGTREIVHGHRGRIGVQSKVGEGTTFTIWLPL